MCTKWHRLLCNRKELQLKGTLNGGQSFRWKYSKEKDQWIGVFFGKLWILEQHDDHVAYQVYESDDDEPPGKKTKPEKDHGDILRDYFQLQLRLDDYYKKWSEVDPYFKEAAEQFYGIRILKQDVVENIFSFICSSNNNISRISSMVEKLAKFYGEKICDFDGVSYYRFPDIDDLAESGVEQKLRENGFGYRAKYINRAAQTIVDNGGNAWIKKLQSMCYEDAKKSLMNLMGIGAKVADCICLMSLGHLQAIPVDTHIYQIAARFYMPKLRKQKTVTEKVYNEIGEHFKILYGPLAGWAHTVLFCADLKKFQENSSTETKKRRKKSVE